MILKVLAIVMTLGIATTSPCFAQFRVIPGDTDPGGCEPTTPARICIRASGANHCFAPSSTKDYVFGLDPKALQIGRLHGAPLVLFSAMFSGCGSGTLTDYSLLSIKNDEFVNLAPTIRLTNQSEYKIWMLPKISSNPVFATADFIWDFQAMDKSGGNEETHFAPHHYHIDAYVFDPNSQRYVRRVAFDTKKKYPGLDQTDEIRVLDAEKPELLRRLR